MVFAQTSRRARNLSSSAKNLIHGPVDGSPVAGTPAVFAYTIPHDGRAAAHPRLSPDSGRQADARGDPREGRSRDGRPGQGGARGAGGAVPRGTGARGGGRQRGRGA